VIHQSPVLELSLLMARAFLWLVGLAGRAIANIDYFRFTAGLLFFSIFLSIIQEPVSSNKGAGEHEQTESKLTRYRS
jgi:small neutral amino acid transporter SnatA (MarC family)